MTSDGSALSSYAELVAKVDAFFGRVNGRHAAEMACRAGCDQCCRQELSITSVEARVLTRLVEALPAVDRARLRASAATANAWRCAALADDGRCAVYEARPLVCRSHGLPIRVGTRHGLPVVGACDLNFTALGPAAAEPDCILDQELLSTLLHAVDASFRREHGGTGDRVTLPAVLLAAT